MNVALLEDIKARILTHPEQLDMSVWTCGTAHCIAGTALHLSGNAIVNPRSIPYKQVTADGCHPGVAAAAVLELPRDEDGENEAADRLFQLECWPEDLQERYNDTREDWCENPLADRAQIAAERIDRFVASGGAE